MMPSIQNDDEHNDAIQNDDEHNDDIQNDDEHNDEIQNNDEHNDEIQNDDEHNDEIQNEDEHIDDIQNDDDIQVHDEHDGAIQHHNDTIQGQAEVIRNHTMDQHMVTLLDQVAILTERFNGMEAITNEDRNVRVKSISTRMDKQEAMNNRMTQAIHDHDVAIQGHDEVIGNNIIDENVVTLLDQMDKLTERVNIMETISKKDHDDRDKSMSSLMDKQEALDKRMTEIINQSNSTKTVVTPQVLVQQVPPNKEPAPVDMDNNKTSAPYYLVQGVKDPLSNFYSCKMEINIKGRNVVMQSAEHGFQYRKAMFLAPDDTPRLRNIMNAKSPGTAKWLGDQLQKDPNIRNIDSWVKQEMNVMTDILETKAKCCPAFNKKLLQSNTAELYHSVTDLYWGIGVETSCVVHPISNIVGQNQFGKLLMKLRQKLRSHTSEIQNHNQRDVTTPKQQTASRQTPITTLPHNRPHRSLAEMVQQGVPQQWSPPRNTRKGLPNQYPISPQNTRKGLPNQYPISPSNVSMTKPVALLVGNSLLKNINERALSQKCEVKKIEAPNIVSVRDELLKYNGPSPACVVIQAITNEARDVTNPSKSIQECVEGFDVTLDIIHDRWPTCEPIVGLAPPRADNVKSANIQSIINHTLRLQLADKSIQYINMDDFGSNGYPIRQYYDDNIHFSQSGTRLYASRIKRRIQETSDVKG